MPIPYLFKGIVMEINKMTKRFNQASPKYDQQRRFFIPCFDDFYGAGILFLASIRNDFRSILDLDAGTGLLTKFLYERFPGDDLFLKTKKRKKCVFTFFPTT
jgi:hypothetical protein